MRALFAIFITVAFLAACISSDNYAPVVQAQAYPKNRTIHTVRKGETLYSIAWRHESDYRTLAKLNGLRSPYTLRIGQKIRLKNTRKVAQKVEKRPIKQRVAVKKATKKPIKKTTKKPTKIATQGRKTPKSLSKDHRSSANAKIISWRWPVRGKVARNFSPQQGSKGIDIANRYGSPIVAAASGVVAYAGSGLKGYGNLLIIKHNNEFLSAYAHNSKLLVKEGEKVNSGQRIAQMGRGSANQAPMLHFEIRKAGKPVNPRRYLR